MKTLKTDCHKKAGGNMSCKNDYNYINSYPNDDGFYMPAEFEFHKGTIIIWPKRPGSWIYGAVKAREAFANVVCTISESEQVFVLAEADVIENARKTVELIRKKEGYNSQFSIDYIEMESDDAWARDVAPTFVKNKNGLVRAIDWQFNAWGGEYDGLYASWDKDDRLAKLFCQKQGYDVYDAHPFVLEGGSIHSDGEGTVIVTEACLLSKGRNPTLSKFEIEDKLKKYLGAQKIIWLPYGIYNDETNEHVDNICAFSKPGHVLLAWTDKTSDPQYEMSAADFTVLSNETDAKGRKLVVHKLPIPEKPVCINEYELAGFEFEEGEDEREAGERLAASYANFYITNGGVLVPQFGDEMDKKAIEIIGKCFPDRKIYPIFARDIIVGGGNIHCITQQIPQ